MYFHHLLVDYSTIKVLQKGPVVWTGTWIQVQKSFFRATKFLWPSDKENSSAQWSCRRRELHTNRHSHMSTASSLPPVLHYVRDTQRLKQNEMVFVWLHQGRNEFFSPQVCWFSVITQSKWHKSASEISITKTTTLNCQIISDNKSTTFFILSEDMTNPKGFMFHYCSEFASHPSEGDHCLRKGCSMEWDKEKNSSSEKPTVMSYSFLFEKAMRANICGNRRNLAASQGEGALMGNDKHGQVLYLH